MADLEITCRCGKVTGVARNVSPRLGNRLICYCASCQQFPGKLGRAQEVLDEYGGTDIYQLPPSHLEITNGKEHLRCLKLTPDGLPRFYAGCCNTPIANAPGPGMPFVGLIHIADAHPDRRETLIGPIRAHFNTSDAVKALPAERKRGTPALIFRFLGQMLFWRLTGKGAPHPFFDDEGQPVVEPEVR